MCGSQMRLDSVSIRPAFDQDIRVGLAAAIPFVSLASLVMREGLLLRLAL
jgi:hypothetical protein